MRRFPPKKKRPTEAHIAIANIAVTAPRPTEGPVPFEPPFVALNAPENDIGVVVDVGIGVVVEVDGSSGVVVEGVERLVFGKCESRPALTVIGAREVVLEKGGFVMGAAAPLGGTGTVDVVNGGGSVVVVSGEGIVVVGDGLRVVVVNGGGNVVVGEGRGGGGTVVAVVVVLGTVVVVDGTGGGVKDPASAYDMWKKAAPNMTKRKTGRALRHLTGLP